MKKIIVSSLLISLSLSTSVATSNYSNLLDNVQTNKIVIQDSNIKNINSKNHNIIDEKKNNNIVDEKKNNNIVDEKKNNNIVDEKKNNNIVDEKKNNNIVDEKKNNNIVDEKKNNSITIKKNIANLSHLKRTINTLLNKMNLYKNKIRFELLVIKNLKIELTNKHNTKSFNTKITNKMHAILLNVYNNILKYYKIQNEINRLLNN